MPAITKLNTYEVAALLGKTPTDINADARNGHLPSHRVHEGPARSGSNAFWITDIVSYAKRGFSTEELETALVKGKELQREKADRGKALRDLKKTQVAAAAIGTVGRSLNDAAEPAEVSETSSHEEIAAVQDQIAPDLDRLYAAGLQRAGLVWPKVTPAYKAALAAAFVGYVAGMKANLTPDDEILIQRLAAQYT